MMAMIDLIAVSYLPGIPGLHARTRARTHARTHRTARNARLRARTHALKQAGWSLRAVVSWLAGLGQALAGLAWLGFELALAWLAWLGFAILGC